MPPSTFRFIFRWLSDPFLTFTKGISFGIGGEGGRGTYDVSSGVRSLPFLAGESVMGGVADILVYGRKSAV